MAACTELGCATEYSVFVADRGGRTMLTAETLPYTRLSWGRVLDGTSTAQLVVDTGQAPDCCGLLAGLRTWRHELIIYRDQDRVWEGPITAIGPAGRDRVTIDAQDVTAWLGVRGINRDLCWHPDECPDTQPADLSTIAQALIVEGLQLDDPNVLPYLQVSPSGQTGERHYTPDESETVLDELEELARTSLDYTAVGRSIIIGSPLAFGQLAQLRCDDVVGDIATVEDGVAAATRVVVIGDGVVGTAGGLDPYWGLIERRIRDDSIKDLASAVYAAREILRGSNPPPTYVYVPRGSQLAPSAPVCINDLVPGVLVPAYVDCTCRPTTTVLRLLSLQVEVDAAGEQVRPVLVPLGVA
jgi:hypothetical protein